MSFKKPNKLFTKTFSNSYVSYEWNDNAEFVKVVRNYQDEINSFKGLDLKSMYERNIMPDSNISGSYVDTTIFKDVSLSKLNDCLSVDVVIDDETGEIINNDNSKDINNTVENNKDINTGDK